LSAEGLATPAAILADYFAYVEEEFTSDRA